MDLQLRLATVADHPFLWIHRNRSRRELYHHGEGWLTLYVGRLAVLPEYRRRGIGEVLLRASERRAGELGFTRVRLGVRLALDKLRAFCEARGYVPIAFRSHVGYTEATYVEMEEVLEHRVTKWSCIPERG